MDDVNEDEVELVGDGEEVGQKVLARLIEDEMRE